MYTLYVITDETAGFILNDEEYSFANGEEPNRLFTLCEANAAAAYIRQHTDAHTITLCDENGTE